MGFPINAAKVLRFMEPTLSQPDDYQLIDRESTGIEFEYWNTGPEPTEQEIIDASNDLTVVNGQTFSQWLAEHGGDPVATFRRQAKEALDKQSSETEGLIRALALVVLDEINTLRGQHALAPRTAQQLRDAIKSKLTAGDADS